VTLNAEQQRAYLHAMGIPLWQLRQPHLLQQAPAVVERLAAPAVEPWVEKVEMSWSALRQQVDACTTCPERQTRSQPILAAGSEQAELLIVGEMPSGDEDRSAAPFVAASGQLLEGMLNAIGLSRQAVYLTNIVKCHLE